MSTLTSNSLFFLTSVGFNASRIHFLSAAFGFHVAVVWLKLSAHYWWNLNFSQVGNIIVNRIVKSFMIIALFSLLAVLLSAFSLQAGTSGGLAAADTLTHVKNWSQSSPMEKAQAICVVIAGITFVVAEIWFIVAGFKASVGWGLFMLFIGGMRSIFCALAVIAWLIQWMWLTHQGATFHDPLNMPLTILGIFVAFAGTGAIVFIIRHWKHARQPLAVMAFGFLLILAAVGLNFAK